MATSVERFPVVGFIHTPEEVGFRLAAAVNDELLQLVEMPRVNTTPVTPVSDTFQVLEFQNGILELLCPVDEATGGFVIEVRI